MKKRQPMALIAVAFSRFVFFSPSRSLFRSLLVTQRQMESRQGGQADVPELQGGYQQVSSRKSGEEKKTEERKEQEVTRGDNDDGRWCSTRRIDFAVSFSPRSCC
jgi:hypothetical protein